MAPEQQFEHIVVHNSHNPHSHRVCAGNDSLSNLCTSKYGLTCFLCWIYKWTAATFKAFSGYLLKCWLVWSLPDKSLCFLGFFFSIYWQFMSWYGWQRSHCNRQCWCMLEKGCFFSAGLDRSKTAWMEYLMHNVFQTSCHTDLLIAFFWSFTPRLFWQTADR